VLVHKPLSQTLSRGAAIEVKSVTWDAAARKIIDIYHQL
jgi:hypothetical protein